MQKKRVSWLRMCPKIELEGIAKSLGWPNDIFQKVIDARRGFNGFLVCVRERVIAANIIKPDYFH